MLFSATNSAYIYAPQRADVTKNCVHLSVILLVVQCYGAFHSVLVYLIHFRIYRLLHMFTAKNHRGNLGKLLAL